MRMLTWTMMKRKRKRVTSRKTVRFRVYFIWRVLAT